MLTNRVLLALICCLIFATHSQAELTLEITRGVDNPTEIAIVPIKLNGALPSVDVSAIVAEDLRRSGLFTPMPRQNMLSNPASAQEVYFRDWRIAGMEYVVVGKARRHPDNRIHITYSLLEVPGSRVLMTEEAHGTELRAVAHYISDRVFEKITGIRGAFSTWIAYVTATPGPGDQITYRLMVADADGARERLVLESKQPIMSPSWSPDGNELVYVSFETGRPAIFRQRLSDSSRQQLTNFRGLNGAPAWSPDGRRLALVLSKDGNPEIYLYDMVSAQFTRLTRHFGIDTEPNWTPDGKAIVFTSDRGGSPQIYQLTLGGGELKRLTYTGSYNARPRLAPDGRTLVMIHRNNGPYHIASQDLVTGDVRVLTSTHMDESPTVAPNGAMVMYSAKIGNKGVLAAVSIDAGARFLLPARTGNVREPAWSPFLR